jgi:hypothetical protein
MYIDTIQIQTLRDIATQLKGVGRVIMSVRTASEALQAIIEEVEVNDNTQNRFAAAHEAKAALPQGFIDQYKAKKQAKRHTMPSVGPCGICGGPVIGSSLYVAGKFYHSDCYEQIIA